MGPIEKELRELPFMMHSADTCMVAYEAARRLRVLAEFVSSDTADDEVLSEAIEAAKALGL